MSSTENMESMFFSETQASGEKHPGPPTTGPPRKKFKKKHPQYPADIVFSKGNFLQTVPSLSKLLKGVTGIIGLQYVWEYRSPSKTVQPHYLCKLCSLSCVQHDITDHVKGWKHCFKYMKKYHSDKITFEEEDVVKDPSLKGPLRAAAAEVEKAEGRGQIRVILREPFDVPSFKGFRSAAPRIGPPPPRQGLGPMGPPFGPGPRFHDSGFSGEFSPQGDPFSKYGEYEEPGFGGYMSRDTFTGPGMDRAPFSDDLGQRLPGGGNGFGPGEGRARYGRSGQQDEGTGKMYQGAQMGDSFNDRPLDRPEGMGAASASSSLPNTLLTYLDTFQIENESDAQLVLKVTQKLTDVLMEYRLRSISGGSNANSSMSNDEQFSSNPSGPSRYSDRPSQYYN
ncbi:uncharacterized protein si:ch211-197h24.6 [Kryptolebias marmoratus]|uniref:Si:ch211-197h24.6 n=1 Tax=Kryptolebias marmoratus TaxID=37003 RepID=A0A3Q2ZTK3_KRYMA|nr:uncharacterized protein si:ch211-197h24.6 [Kryptolebias marmoratus]